MRVACAEKLHHVPHHASTPQPDFPPHPRLLPSLLLLPTQKLTVPLLLFFPNQAMEEETLFHTRSAIPSPEFNGRRVKDDDDELLHHHNHLFLVGDLGEGHPQTSFLLHQALEDELEPIYTYATLLQQVAPCSCSTHRR